MRLSKSLFATILISFLGAIPALADEGLWLFNDSPFERVKSEYDYTVTQEFLDHLRLSSTRLYPYGSGSFVSAEGLVFTNHHVASDCIQKLTTADHNYMKNGFHATSIDEEKACPDLEINILIDIKDVTSQVKGAAGANASTAEANRARKAEMSRIEKACMDAGGDRCDVESLYSGGQYHLYTYKKYNDVRLVFAPEEAIAAFGGDPDNFTFPRYCLDFTFFRVYEDGKPARTKNYLKWSSEGVRDGELTFVSGHPGTTGRLLTYAALKFYRDVYPLVLERMEAISAALEAYSSQSEENKRIARDNLLGWQNSRKAYRGFLSGLRDEELMSRKLAEETRLRQAVEADPELKAKFGALWDGVADAYAEYEKFYPRYYLLEPMAARGSELFRVARGVVRLAKETAKPDAERLREYSEAALPSTERFLFSEVPIAKPMEKVVLEEYFTFLRDKLGGDDPVVNELLAGRSPKKAADYYVSGTKLESVDFRKELAASVEAVEKSDDTMIRLARIIETPARQLRKRYEDKVEAVIDASAGRIAQARYAVFGAGDYPDATFTLRLSYGPVKGYIDASGNKVPFATRVSGLYQRATGKDPFKLPSSWIKHKKDLNPDTQFNFVTTNDTHGGNSGSPTVSTKGEVIGILFDGNIESLPNRFVYTDERSRSVHVSTEVITEALRKIYKADRLLRELGVE